MRPAPRPSHLLGVRLDVMRATAISHYVRDAAGSYADAAKHFGNSESVIRKHYEGRVSAEQTKAFYAIVAAKLANMKHGGDRKTNQDANLHLDPITIDQAADLLNVSRRTVCDAKAVIEEAPEEIAAIESAQASEETETREAQS